MRGLAALMLVMLLTAWAPAWALLPPITQAEALRFHAQGSCGSLQPGAGLGADGRGWVVSAFPGPHEFRARGQAFTFDMDAGRPYYLELQGADARTQLEWLVPGHAWGTVPPAMLYPAVQR